MLKTDDLSVGDYITVVEYLPNPLDRSWKGDVFKITAIDLPYIVVDGKWEYTKGMTLNTCEWKFKHCSEAYVQATGIYDRLKRPQGLCTSIQCSDEENAERIKCIIDAHLKGHLLESANRNKEDWEYVHNLPMDFISFRYRLMPNEISNYCFE